jgi:calcineurin-like phosphoesterase family protein
MRFFTADLHLGHANIISYCARPFASVAAMNDALLANWSSTVGDGDEVWVLGDVALGRITETLPLLATLPGRKHLVPGNHDRCWPGHRRLRSQDKEMYTDVGFEIHFGSVALELGGVPVVACHFPVAGDSQAEDRFVDHRPDVPADAWLLHGHVHEKWKVNKRQINVGVDVWDFHPVSEEKLLGLMSSDEGG